MPLQEGATYIAPDGRRFRAELDKKQYGPHRSWTLVPAEPQNGGSWRDKLELLLFLDDDGKVIQFDFSTPRIVKYTGWSAADLRPEM